MYRSLEKIQIDNLNFVAQSEAIQIADFVEKKEKFFQQIATSRAILNYSEDFSGNILLGSLESYKEDFPEMWYVSEDGQEEFHFSHGDYGNELHNIKGSRLFQKLLSEINQVLTLVEDDAHPSEAIIEMGYFRKNFFDVFEGILIARFTSSSFFSDFSGIKVGQTGFLMIVDNQGNVISYPKKQKIIHQQMELPGASSRQVMQQATAMKTGSGRAKLLGVDGFVAFTPVEDRRWSLIAVLPYQEFSAPLNELTRHFLIIVAALSIIVILMVFRMSSSLSNPLIKLTASSRKLAKGNLAERVEINAQGEIGELQQSFNAMAQQLESSQDDLDRSALAREQLIEELETKNAELERFTYTVSHDLKSPLVTIKGFIGLLKQDIAKGDHERVQRDLDQIAFASDNMSALLEDLLELSRVGRVKNHFETVDLNELFEHVQQLLQGKISQTHATIDCQQNMPSVFADRKRILEVVQNLLENAMKFRQPDIAPEITVSARHEGDQVHCCIQDNGIGIEADYHELIFGLFERLDPDIEGTGIGLALVKRIIDVHKGTLCIQSAGKNAGTLFCFSLPAAN